MKAGLDLLSVKLCAHESGPSEIGGQGVCNCPPTHQILEKIEEKHSHSKGLGFLLGPTRFSYLHTALHSFAFVCFAQGQIPSILLAIYVQFRGCQLGDRIYQSALNFANLKCEVVQMCNGTYFFQLVLAKLGPVFV